MTEDIGRGAGSHTGCQRAQLRAGRDGHMMISGWELPSEDAWRLISQVHVGITWHSVQSGGGGGGGLNSAAVDCTDQGNQHCQSYVQRVIVLRATRQI